MCEVVKRSFNRSFKNEFGLKCLKGLFIRCVPVVRIILSGLLPHKIRWQGTLLFLLIALNRTNERCFSFCYAV